MHLVVFIYLKNKLYEGQENMGKKKNDTGTMKFNQHLFEVEKTQVDENNVETWRR